MIRRVVLILVPVLVSCLSHADDLENVFRSAPAKLEALPNQTLRIAVGEFKYEGVVPSAFGEYLATEISALLAKMPAFEEIARNDLKKVLEEQKLSMSGLLEEGSTIKAGALKGVQAIVYGNFWDAQDHVKVGFSFVNTETGKRFTVNGNIAKDHIPSSIALKPENYKAVAKALELWGESEGKSKELKSKVWVDSPDGLYRKGETIVIHFVVNKNCYARLYHTDSSGKIQVLFPNSFVTDNAIKANDVCSIPTDEMGFTFDVSEPYGSEVLKLMVSMQPFKDSESTPKLGAQEPFKEVGSSDAKTIGRIRRGIKITPVEQRSEATCIFTTVEK